MADKWKIMADDAPSAIAYLSDTQINNHHLWQIADFVQNLFTPAPHVHIINVNNKKSAKGIARLQIFL